MLVFWINLIAVFGLAALARTYARQTAVGPVYLKPRGMLVAAAAASLVIVAGLRDGIGDTFFYMHEYAVTDFRLSEVSLSGDFGYEMLAALLQTVTDDPQAIVFVTALATNALVVLVLARYSRMFELALFLYIATGLYTISMNGIRQFLAAAVFLTATRYVLRGDWKKYMLTVLIASTFHKSALILIPIYFIVRREAWSKLTLLLLAGGAMIAVGFNAFAPVLFAAIENTKYGVYQDFNEGGANALRVLINAMPVALAWLGRRRLRALWPQSDVIVNLSLMSCLFMIIAMQNWIFARFNIYFGLYNVILMTWVVPVFAPSSRKLVYYAVVVFYLAYYYYETFVSLGLVYESDYIKL